MRLKLGFDDLVLAEAREPILEIKPEVAHFLRGGRARQHFADRAAIDHAGGKINAVMNGDRSDYAVLRKRDRGLARDAGALRGLVDDEEHRLVVALGDVHGGPYRAQIVRTRTGWDDHQVSLGDDLRDGFGDRRRSVDQSNANAAPLQVAERAFEI